MACAENQTVRHARLWNAIPVTGWMYRCMEKKQGHKSTPRRVLEDSDSQPRWALSPGAAHVSLTLSGISERRAGCVRSRRICGKFPHYAFVLVLYNLFPYIIIARQRRRKSYDSRFRALSSSLVSVTFISFFIFIKLLFRSISMIRLCVTRQHHV